jgi:hypothetical protein
VRSLQFLRQTARTLVFVSEGFFAGSGIPTIITVDKGASAFKSDAAVAGPKPNAKDMAKQEAPKQTSTATGPKVNTNDVPKVDSTKQTSTATPRDADARGKNVGVR